MKQYVDIILASGSPRRKELLTQAGLAFTVRVSNEEESITNPDPAELVKELALLKSRSVLSSLKAEKVGTLSDRTVIIGADTIVVRDGVILGKPSDEEDALNMLMSLSGRKHQVLTGVCALYNESPAILFAEETLVEFTSFTEKEARAYIATKEPMDKAGAYGIQGLGSFLVKGITGDFHSVMGFPLGSFLRKGMSLGWFAL